MQPQKQLKILLIGETCDDEYVYVDVEVEINAADAIIICE